jgi:hypothetical protein
MDIKTQEWTMYVQFPMCMARKKQKAGERIKLQ